MLTYMRTNVLVMSLSELQGFNSYTGSSEQNPANISQYVKPSLPITSVDNDSI